MTLLSQLSHDDRRPWFAWTRGRALDRSSLQSKGSASQALEDERVALYEAAQGIAWQGERERSERAREALLSGGSLAVLALLDAVAEARPEVQFEAAAILARLATEESAFAILLNEAATSNRAAPARATAARGLGWAELSPISSREAVKTLAAMLSDPSAELRDATVAALADRGGDVALRALRGALNGECEEFIREAILEAIEAR